MVHIGGGQYLKADDPSLVKKEGDTLTGQPSFSSARASAVQPLPTITKQEIMSHTVFRAPTRQEIRKQGMMHLEYEDVITCYREDDHVLVEMLGITSDMDSCPLQGEAGDDVDDYGPDFISVVQNAPEYEHYDKMAHRRDQGIQAHSVAVRRPLGERQGTPAWIGSKETTQNVPGRPRPPSHRAVGFQFRGRFRDPRATIGQAHYPLWVAAGHGHHRALADHRQLHRDGVVQPLPGPQSGAYRQVRHLRG